jgi:hypothetical protein
LVKILKRPAKGTDILFLRGKIIFLDELDQDFWAFINYTYSGTQNILFSFGILLLLLSKKL